MALCDRGHPSVSSPGPALSHILGGGVLVLRPNCHKGKSGGGVSATPFPRHSAEGSNEQKPTSRIRKGELTRQRSYAPVPAPLFVSEGIYFFLRTHPLEVCWSWNCGVVVIPVVFSSTLAPSLRISSSRPATSVVDIPQSRPPDRPCPISWGAASSSSVPIVIREKAGGVSPPRLSRGTPSLKAG